MKLGVSRVTLSRVVTGASGISADMAYRLAQAFGTSVQMWVVCGGPSLVGQGAWLHRPVLLRTLPRTFAKQNHNETFGLCVTELQKLEPDYARLARELEKRTVTESIDWLTIDVFTRDHAPNPRREIADAFSQYINTLDKCVETIEGERGIVFYGGLRNCIPSPILAQFLRPGDSGFGRPSLNSQELREKNYVCSNGAPEAICRFLLTGRRAPTRIEENVPCLSHAILFEGNHHLLPMWIF